MTVDEQRLGRVPPTGVYVRAQHNGEWGSYDIAHVDKESLLEWLRSKSNPYVISVILNLLEHPHFDE